MKQLKQWVLLEIRYQIIYNFIMQNQHQTPSKYKTLCVFTVNYPYTPGEQFFHDEINYLAKNFDDISIVSMESNLKKTRVPPPKNCRVVGLDRKKFLFRSLLKAVAKMFSPATFKEMRFAKKELGWNGFFKRWSRIFSYYLYSGRQVAWIKKNIEKNNNQIILYSYWLGPTAYGLAKFKKSGYKFKAISRAHGYDAFLDRGYQPFRKEIYKHLDEIHFISNNAKVAFEEKLANYISKPNATLYTSHLGLVNTSNKINPDSNDSTSFTIVSCSNIVDIKRIDMIIDALGELKHLPIYWRHFGSGPLLNSLLDHAKATFENTNINFSFEGQLSNEKIMNYYETTPINLFINTSDNEGIPFSIMEANSYGIPALGRDVGGMSEIIEDGNNGILLPKDAGYEAVAKAILDFMDKSETEIRQMRLNAFANWDNSFNALKNYSLFYKTIIK